MSYLPASLRMEQEVRHCGTCHDACDCRTAIVARLARALEDLLPLTDPTHPVQAPAHQEAVRVLRDARRAGVVSPE